MHFRKLIPAALLLIAAIGCSQVDFKKTKSGMPYKIFSDNKGAKLQTGNFVKVNYIVTITNGSKDSVLQSTYEQGRPFYMPVNLSVSQPYDISEILPQLRKGDSLVVVQSVDTFLRRSPLGAPPFLKKGGKLTTRMRIMDVFANEAAARADERKARDNEFAGDKDIQAQMRADDATLQQLFQQSNIKTQKIPVGTYIEILSAGSGPKVKEGDNLDVFYTGRVLNGKTFDSNVDSTFGHTQALPVKIGSGSMLRGFEDALAQLREGDKARLYIPSALGYGKKGNPQGGIAPNSILVFDVEVRRIVPEAEMNQPQMHMEQPAH